MQASGASGHMAIAAGPQASAIGSLTSRLQLSWIFGRNVGGWGCLLLDWLMHTKHNDLTWYLAMHAVCAHGCWALCVGGSILLVLSPVASS
jgi:hypothetical protein